MMFFIQNQSVCLSAFLSVCLFVWGVGGGDGWVIVMGLVVYYLYIYILYNIRLVTMACDYTTISGKQGYKVKLYNYYSIIYCIFLVVMCCF